MGRPSIYEYGNYRNFLAAFVQYLRSIGKYSHRKFADKAGFKAQSHLQWVIDHKRNLSEEGAEKVAKGLELSDRESKFFVLLVLFNQSEDLEDQNLIYEKLQKFARAQLVRQDRLDQFELFSEWYNVPIYESLKREWQEIDFSFYAKSMGIREKLVEKSIEMLVRMGLVEQDKNKFRKKDAVIETPNEMESLLVRNYHKRNLEVAMGKVGSLKKEERELGAVVFPLSEKSFEKLKERIRQFRSDISTIFAEDPDPEKVFQVSIQAFPVLDLKKE